MNRLSVGSLLLQAMQIGLIQSLVAPDFESLCDLFGPCSAEARIGMIYFIIRPLATGEFELSISDNRGRDPTNCCSCKVCLQTIEWSAINLVENECSHDYFWNWFLFDQGARIQSSSKWLAENSSPYTPRFCLGEQGEVLIRRPVYQNASEPVERRSLRAPPESLECLSDDE